MRPAEICSGDHCISVLQNFKFSIVVCMVKLIINIDRCGKLCQLTGPETEFPEQIHLSIKDFNGTVLNLELI